MKQLMCIVLAALLAINISSPVLAEEVSSNSTLKKESDKYPVVIIGNDELSQQTYYIETPYDGIKKSKEGNYAIAVETEKGIEYVPVGKIEIDLKNKDAVADLMNNEKITQEIKDNIQKKIRGNRKWSD